MPCPAESRPVHAPGQRCEAPSVIRLTLASGNMNRNASRIGLFRPGLAGFRPGIHQACHGVTCCHRAPCLAASLSAPPPHCQSRNPVSHKRNRGDSDHEPISGSPPFTAPVSPRGILGTVTRLCDPDPPVGAPAALLQVGQLVAHPRRSDVRDWAAGICPSRAGTGQCQEGIPMRALSRGTASRCGAGGAGMRASGIRRGGAPGAGISNSKRFRALL